MPNGKRGRSPSCTSAAARTHTGRVSAWHTTATQPSRRQSAALQAPQSGKTTTQPRCAGSQTGAPQPAGAAICCAADVGHHASVLSFHARTFVTWCPNRARGMPSNARLPVYISHMVMPMA